MWDRRGGKDGSPTLHPANHSFHLVDFPVIFVSSEYFHWVVIRPVTSQRFLTHLAFLMFLVGWLEASGEAGWRCKCCRKSWKQVSIFSSNPSISWCVNLFLVPLPDFEEKPLVLNLPTVAWGPNGAVSSPKPLTPTRPWDLYELSGEEAKCPEDDDSSATGMGTSSVLGRRQWQHLPSQIKKCFLHNCPFTLDSHGPVPGTNVGHLGFSCDTAIY